jgi:hypothetical protein
MGGDCSLEALPFARHDTTAGSETELQAIVLGSKDRVDLPITIEGSNFLKNLVKRSAAQETPKRSLREIERFLNDNREGVWENSWVRFPRRLLGRLAQRVFDRDMLADKRAIASGPRVDRDRFLFDAHGEPHVRLPISYAIKLALADVIDPHSFDGPSSDDAEAATGRRLMDHYLNDNTSPETYSFYVVPLRPEDGLGRALAKETSQRFLLTQLLVLYANRRFELDQSGQQAVVYFSPHPPVRQKQLNDCISDAFYRDLFMSPCLSGWDRGEEKHDYMRLCHQVLSRSQLHAVAKVRDAGILAGNLVRLPNVSNISLANNGIHVSLGSKRLSGLLEDSSSGFGPAEEKAVGDLAIKIVEHFLPLLVGTYSAAPYRLDFADFHAEEVLGFLPHQLDFTHLRMIWRRWRKKASVNILGQPVSPSGYDRLDRALSMLFRLNGDFVPDFRLIDYMIAPLSTDQSPALDGRLGNTDRLKRDLADQGVFDTRMSLYMLYRMRAYASMGFSGMEGRYYSLCQSLEHDLGPAVDLQNLITALAYQYILSGALTHDDIPDDPAIESERRQTFFGTAIGVPTFFVRSNTTNRFLHRILARTKGKRASRRYPGHVRVPNVEYRRALVEILREDGAGLVEMLGLRHTLADLDQRIADPRHSAAGRLTAAILDRLNAKTPLHVSAREFNLAAESYYRNDLRREQLREALRFVAEDVRSLESISPGFQLAGRPAGMPPLEFLRRAEAELLGDRATLGTLRPLIALMLRNVERNGRAAQEIRNGLERHANCASSIR